MCKRCKLSLVLIEYYTKEKYGVEELQLRTFLKSVLESYEYLASDRRRFLRMKQSLF